MQEKCRESRLPGPVNGARDLSRYMVAPDGFTAVLKPEAADAQLGHFRIMQAFRYTPFGKELQILMAAARKNLPVMLIGSPGVGKTTSVEALAHELGIPLLTKMGSTGMRVYDLVGYPRDIDGHVFWDDGPLSLCARASIKSILYFDEAIMIPDGVFTSLSDAFDHRRQLSMPTLEVLSTKETMVILSFNPPKFESMDLLPTEAIMDRFVVIRYPKRKGSDVRALLEAKYGGMENGLRKEIEEHGERMSESEALGRFGKVLEDIHDEFNGETFRNEYGGILYGEAAVRSIEKAVLLISAGLDPHTAIEVSMVNGLSPIDDPSTDRFIEAARTIIESKLGQG